MGHKPTEELEKVIAEAKLQVEIGAVYKHYQSEGVYTVVDIVMIEDGYEAGILYTSSLSPSLKWLRPLDNWREMVTDSQGRQVSRFTKVGSMD